MMDLAPDDLEELAKLFAEESKERLLLMEDALLALEQQPEDRESLLTIYRHAHNLKGTASCVGFSAVAEFSHAVEDVLRDLSGGLTPVDGELVGLLLQAVDTLRLLVKAASLGQSTLSPEQQGLFDRLRDFTSRVRALPGLPGLPGLRGVCEPLSQTIQVEGQMSSIAADQAYGTESAASIGLREGTNAGKTLRIDVDKLDRMLNLTSEIAIYRSRLTQLLRNGNCKYEDVVETHRGMDPLCLELQDMVTKARMVPVGPTFRQFARTVRDMAASHGKQASLIVEGDDVEVDTAIIERIRDPLTHMIRNSIGHGIESPAERIARNKDPRGTIRLRACHESGSIVIQVIDDGAGLDKRQIIEQARNQNLPVEPDKMTEQEIFELVFQPGFSTAQAVTDLSGRGLGMDVVRRNIEGLRGFAGIESQLGHGTTITIRLPLTLSIIAGLQVGAADQTYIVPMDEVLEIIELPESERDTSEVDGVVSLRGRPLPFLRLSNFLKLAGSSAAREQIVVFGIDDEYAGVAVDTVYGETQAVIKPLGRLFRSVREVSGSAVLSNGEVALVLDVTGILRRALASGSARMLAMIDASRSAPEASLTGGS
jgi:two-component system, chemotaxis family, sensor kinase CheA